MYAKIYAQIFDSSIADDYQIRHVFEDLLKLCDRDGIVDMTMEAISRRTNVPLEIVRRGIERLMDPDSESRTADHDGRRILPIEAHRTWGWIIVNYDKYRAMQDEDARRAYNREAKRREREKAKLAKGKRAGKPLPGETLTMRGVENGILCKDCHQGIHTGPCGGE